jgi:hypothetical protein
VNHLSGSYGTHGSRVFTACGDTGETNETLTLLVPAGAPATVVIAGSVVLAKEN